MSRTPRLHAFWTDARRWWAQRQKRPHIDAQESVEILRKGIRLGRAVAEARADGVITPEELAELTREAAEAGLDIREALED